MTVFSIPVTVHRYVRAHGIDDAQRHVGLGAQIAIAPDTDNHVSAHYVSARVAPYHHAGAGADLWRVSLDLRAVVDAADAQDASEAAYGMVLVDGRSDAFEPELCVGDARRALPRAS